MFSPDGRLAIVVRSDGHVLALRTQGGEVIGALHAFGRDAADQPGVVSVYGEPGGDELVFVGARSVARWSLTEDTVTALTTPELPQRFEFGTFWRPRATWVARDVQDSSLTGTALDARGTARRRWHLPVDDPELWGVVESDDGEYAVLLPEEGTASLRDARGRQIADLGDVAELAHVRFAPDAQTLATLSPVGVLTLWATRDGTRQREVVTSGEPRAAHWARDGEHVYVFQRDDVNVVAIARRTGAVALVPPQSLWLDAADLISPRPHGIESASEEIIAVSPDGSYALLESDTAFRFVRTSDGATLGRTAIGGHALTVTGALWLPGHELLLRTTQQAMRIGPDGSEVVPCVLDPTDGWTRWLVAPRADADDPSAHARFVLDDELHLCPLNTAAREVAAPADLRAIAPDAAFTLPQAGVILSGDAPDMRLHRLPRMDGTLPFAFPPDAVWRALFLDTSRELLMLSTGSRVLVYDTHTARVRFSLGQRDHEPRYGYIAPDGGGVVVGWARDNDPGLLWRAYGRSGETLEELADSSWHAFYLTPSHVALRRNAEVVVMDLTRRSHHVLGARRDDVPPLSCSQVADSEAEPCEDLPYYEPEVAGHGEVLVITHEARPLATARLDAFLPPYAHVHVSAIGRAEVSPDGQWMVSCARDRLIQTHVPTRRQRELGPCLHGELVVGDDPRFVAVLAGTTTHVVRADGARIALRMVAHEGRQMNIVHDPTRGSFELLGDEELAGLVRYRLAGDLRDGRMTDQLPADRRVSGLMQDFFGGAAMSLSPTPATP